METPNFSSANPNSNLRMQQQFVRLQNHWNHYKKTTTSKSDPNIHPTMLPNDSPPEDDLISSLHRHGTATYSASSTWKIRTNELAQDEIRRERRAAIATGKLNCRRLSYDDDDFYYWNSFLQDQIPAAGVPSIQPFDSPEEKEEEVPDCLNVLSYSSASSSSSSSFSSSSVIGKEVKEQMAAANTKVEHNVTPTLSTPMPKPTPTVGKKAKIGNWCKIGKWEVVFAWLGIASVVMFIFSVRCLGIGAFDQERLPNLLVPT